MAARPPLLIPANIFSISFGLAGLAMVWNVASRHFGAPWIVVDVLTALAFLVWAVLVVLYVRRIIANHTSLLAELTHPVTAPFLSLVPVTLLVLVPVVVERNPTAAGVLAVGAALITALLGAWLVGRWVGHGIPEASLHAGYYLPTVAAGLIGATAFASVGLPAAAMMAFGLGIACWLLMGSIITNRNFVVSALPAVLVPTIAIDVAPPVVAGNAWFTMNPGSGSDDVVQLMLAGCAVFLVLVQLRLLPKYRSLSFGPSFWAFTFSYCAVASYALRWIAVTQPSGATWLAWTVITVITAFLLVIAALSIRGLVRGTFLPREAALAYPGSPG
ncbi:MAG: hypothetical protein U0R64_02640 [Candidatus Nanopelagicales bacterium]